MSLPVLCAAFAGFAYAVEVLLYPQLIAKEAVAYARTRGKPILNVGAGTENSSLRAMLLGSTLWGDINIDIAAPKDAACGPDRVCWGDALDLSRWPDKYFASSIASHVLEHVKEPQKMMREMQRVSERVYLVVPSVFAPHSLFYWDHRWQITNRTACSLLWNPEHNLWSCYPLPYSLDKAREGDFSGLSR